MQHGARLSEEHERLVEILNELFSLFDEIVVEYRLEKSKTVGDAYLAVRGALGPSHSGCRAPTR